MSSSSSAKTPPDEQSSADSGGASSHLETAPSDEWQSHEDSFLRAAVASPVAGAQTTEPDRVGTELAKYKIQREIGRGGMGIVFAAEDKKLRRRVALKVLPQKFALDPERRQRFLREARATSTIAHRNVATVFEVDEAADGSVYIAMELVEGSSLRTLLRKAALPAAEAVRVAREVLLGLEKAHEAGIVHRDLKPDNVMVTNDGSVKLLDFGLAKPIGTRDTPVDADATAQSDLVTVEGRVLGTPSYMSPEQAKGEAVDERSDVFSFGVLLYEMLTGRRPFVAKSTVALLIAIDRDAPRPISQLVPSVPRRLERLVERCLEKDASRRFASCGEVLAALDALDTAPSRAPLLAVALAVVSVGAIGATWGSSRPASSESPVPTPTAVAVSAAIPSAAVSALVTVAEPAATAPSASSQPPAAERRGKPASGAKRAAPDPQQPQAQPASAPSATLPPRF